MARKSTDPLKDLSQDEISVIMKKRPKDMSDDETRVYKKVKYNEWIARGKKRVPRQTNKSNYEPIEFVQQAENKFKQQVITTKIAEASKTKDLVIERKSAPVGNGKIPGWVNVPEPTPDMKNWVHGRQVLVSFDGLVKICKITWPEHDEMPTIHGPGVPEFHFAWPVAFAAVKYAFVRDYKRDAIMKKNDSENKEEEVA